MSFDTVIDDEGDVGICWHIRLQRFGERVRVRGSSTNFSAAQLERRDGTASEGRP